MPKPRFSGGSVSMRRSSSQMLPSDSGIRPAMQLSAVDLPQPEGPSSAMNSPRSMVSESFSSAWAPPKLRLTPSRRNCLNSFFAAGRPAVLGITMSETFFMPASRVCCYLDYPLSPWERVGVRAGGGQYPALHAQAVAPSPLPSPPRGRGRKTHCAYLALPEPISWSHFLKAATSALSSSGCACGFLAIQSAYSARPNSLITSWLFCGAALSGTSFTAGPG
jgi:hypothetical protein